MDIRQVLIKTTKEERNVLAICSGLWAVHPTRATAYMDAWDVDSESGAVQHDYQFTVTHIPTGYSLCNTFTWPEALETVRVIQDSAADWTFDDPKAGKALKAEWQRIKAEVARRLEPAETVAP